jgi:hypothetical protein
VICLCRHHFLLRETQSSIEVDKRTVHVPELSSLSALVPAAVDATNQLALFCTLSSNRDLLKTPLAFALVVRAFLVVDDAAVDDAVVDDVVDGTSTATTPAGGNAGACALIAERRRKR